MSSNYENSKHGVMPAPIDPPIIENVKQETMFPKIKSSNYSNSKTWNYVSKKQSSI